MRFLYFVGFLGLSASVLVNICTLAGVDALNALLVIWPLIFVVNGALQFAGFYRFSGMWPWRSLDEEKVLAGLPPWSRYLVWASRLLGDWCRFNADLLRNSG